MGIHENAVMGEPSEPQVLNPTKYLLKQKKNKGFFKPKIFMGLVLVHFSSFEGQYVFSTRCLIHI